MTDKLFKEYRVGLVMTRAGLNDAQAVTLLRRLRECAKVAHEVQLIVPVIANHGSTTGGPTVTQRTRELLSPLKLEASTFKVRVLDVAPIAELFPLLCTIDEVWCATAQNQVIRESRPAKVIALAQGTRYTSRFKLLPYWVDADPNTRGVTDVRPKKKLTY